MIRTSTDVSAQPFKTRKHRAPQPQFGRDAIFERNDRFERPSLKRSREPEGEQPSLLSPIKQALFNLFKKSRTSSSDSTPKSGPAVSPESYPDVYNIQGRVRSKAVLKTALEQATTEYNNLNNISASPVQKALAGIKLANAQLAADTMNEEAYNLLKVSFDTLEKEGFSPKRDSAPPAYIHGLYNRGCYVLNNELYRKTTEELGKEEMEYNDAIFEGLAVTPPRDYEVRKTLENRILEDLPFLKKAIRLSTGIPDQGLAHVEYLSAKGEVMHALSHLTRNLGHRRQYDQQGLAAFQKALEVLETVSPKDYTPQHLKLREKLSDIKIPHLCSHQHRPEKAETLCAQLDNKGRALGAQMKSSLVRQISDTQLEKLGKANEQAEAAGLNPYDLLMQELLFPEPAPIPKNR